MVKRLARQAVSIVALLLSACSVQFTSPYNAEIASGLAKLYEDVLRVSADISRNALTPATRAKAAYENYAKTYEDWLAQVETMRVMSEIANPQALNCADVAKRLGAIMPNLGAVDMSDVSDHSAAVDCQTTLLLRLKTRISDTAGLHKIACATDNKNIVNDCAGGFGSRSSVVQFGADGQAPLIQPLLRTIRALMRIQEVKKPAGA